jgi:hypothetical protein
MILVIFYMDNKSISINNRFPEIFFYFSKNYCVIDENKKEDFVSSTAVEQYIQLKQF